MKVHLARCDLGSSGWRDAVARVNGILDAMKAAGVISGWRNEGVTAGDGVIGISWTFQVPAAGPGQEPFIERADGTFPLVELRPPMAAVIEVLES